MRRPLCFVVMPFRKSRSDNDGHPIDFDEVFAHLIAPAVEDAGLRPHRADEETLGGIFHKHMFERLAMCEFAVADLSLANPNVFYELGIRHAIRPWSTVLMFRSDVPLPLDVALDAALPYPPDLMAQPAELARLRSQLTHRLVSAQQKKVDSPVHILVSGLPTPEVDHRRVDAMLETIDREGATNLRIVEAKARGLRSLQSLARELGDLADLDSESVVALLLAFRSLNGWADMISVVHEMAPEVADVWVVREQHALALGRTGDYRRAAEILNELLETRPNSETLGLLGGIYKREWRAAVAEGRSTVWTRVLLERAADTYLRGFKHDIRDPYPGVNAVLLLSLAGRAEAAAEIAPVVRYCLDRRLASSKTEYWDFACSLELSILAHDWQGAATALPNVLIRMAEPFEAASTSGNLALMEEWLEKPDEKAKVAALRSEIELRGGEL